MASEFVSLAVIALIAAVAPVIANALPRKPIPETVLLLLLGAVFGPNVLGIIELGEPISLLSELGLAFLFLLAGYEIDPRMVAGKAGRKGLVPWIVTFFIATAVFVMYPDSTIGGIGAIPMAIVLSTTALGTLMPILKERGILGHRVGDAVLAYGVWGELGPILAIAVLLSTRSGFKTAIILAAFLVLCMFITHRATSARDRGTHLYRFLEAYANTTSQTTVRMTVLLLIGLVTFSAVFDLDLVLGAFAAGFVLRATMPEGGRQLEEKLDAIGFGFLIPLFFVVSGAKVDPASVLERPVLLVVFIVMLVVVRTMPIIVSLSMGPREERLSKHERVSVAFYCTTALPIIVAVTSLLVDGGSMESSTASIMVAAGAFSVFLMPLLARVSYRVADGARIEDADDFPIVPIPGIDLHMGDIIHPRRDA